MPDPRVAADAYRFLALRNLELRDAGLLEQLDQFLYLANIHPRTPSNFVLDVGQACACGLERKLVADRAQSKYAADRDVGQIRMMSKSFACEHVAQVNFDEGHGHREKGIAQRDAGVREGSRIDDDEGDAIAFVA